MSEELRNRNSELSDAALEQVSGGRIAVEDVCASCPSKKSGSHSCTFDGRDLDKLKALFISTGVIRANGCAYHRCPYLITP